MQIAKQIVDAVQPLVVTLVGLLFAWLANEVRAKVKSTRVQGVLLRLTDLAETVTGELQQTVVDAVKARAPDQPLDAAFAESVKRQAISKVQAHLGPKGIQEVLTVFGYSSLSDVQSLIASKIESALKSSKQFGPLLASAQVLDTTAAK
jgi:hypothetical protein